MVGTPCYGGQVRSEFAVSLLGTAEALRDAGVRFEWCTAVSSLVPAGRNRIVGSLLESGATHLLWADANQSWDGRDALRWTRGWRPSPASGATTADGATPVARAGRR
jgi:hypothetical protein